MVGSCRKEFVEMFGLKKFFELSKQPESVEYIVAQLNARLQPIERGEVFEDPLDAMLKEHGYGEVSGGGTMMAAEQAGIHYCDIEIQVKHSSSDVMTAIIEKLEELGAPAGSKLKVEQTGDEISFGRLEGLSLSLNGTDLPTEVYEKSDVNELIESIRLSLGESLSFMGWWQGPQNTDLFFYGSSYEQMKAKIANARRKDPLCQKSVVEKIA